MPPWQEKCLRYTDIQQISQILKIIHRFPKEEGVCVCVFSDVEWVSIESRKLVGVIDSLSWTFGYMMLPVMAYGVRDWRWLTVTVTLPLAVALISWRSGLS